MLGMVLISLSFTLMTSDADAFVSMASSTTSSTMILFQLSSRVIMTASQNSIFHPTMAQLMASEGEECCRFSDPDYDPADEFEGLRICEIECDDLEIRQLRVQRQPLCESAEAFSHRTVEVGRTETHNQPESLSRRRRTRHQRRKTANLCKSKACNCDKNMSPTLQVQYLATVRVVPGMIRQRRSLR